MGTSYKTAGVDLDDQFDPDIIGDGPTAPGYKQGGTPLKYAAIKYGSKGPDCGYAQAGVDVSNLWAAKGTAVYALACDGQQANVGVTLPNMKTGSATASFVANADGTYVLSTRKHVSGLQDVVNVVATGTWNILGGASSLYRVRFTLSNITEEGDGSATMSNDAPNFVALTADRSVAANASGTFQSGTDSISATVTIELQRIADGLVFSTSSVGLSALIDGSV